MKKAYYILTGIVDLILMFLFFIPLFPLRNDTSLSAFTFIIMFLALMVASIVGLVNDCFVPGMILVKAGIIFICLGFFVLGVSFYPHFQSILILFIYAGIDFVMTAIGALGIVFGIRIILKKYKDAYYKKKEEKEEEEAAEEDFYVAPFEGTPVVETIWQYKFHGKPEYVPEAMIAKGIAVVALIAVALTGIVLPSVMAYGLDMRWAVETVFWVIWFFISIGAAIALAAVLGSNRAHPSSNIAFVKCEDGNVFIVDYANEDTAKEFGYYDELPSSMTAMSIVKRFGVGALFALLLDSAYYMTMDKCHAYIRTNDIDKKIAEKCNFYGYQIKSVPKFKKHSFYTVMTFNVYCKDGLVHTFKTDFNAFDNCYEGYNEMIEYFEKRFAHR